MIGAGKIATLPEGRSLSYDECGDPDGVPVMIFHGAPGSRIGLAGPEQDEVAERLGVRLVAPDRPGHGFSDHRPQRSVLDWPVDVLALADVLGISRFSVLGVAGGSAYVAACALRIPHRLRAAGIIGGIAPLEAPGVTRGMARGHRALLTAGRWLAWGLERAVRKLGDGLATNPATTLDRLLEGAPEVDRAMVADPRRRQLLIDSYREAFRRGPAGPALDLRLVSQPWGFALSDVPMIVNLWHGLQDTMAPPAMGDYLGRALPRSETRVYADLGQLSLLTNRFEEILTSLLATAHREEGKPVG